MSHLQKSIVTLSLLTLFPHLSFSQTTCKSLTFSTKKTFENCNDLPALDAILHWTYNPTRTTLTMAFTAPPPTSNGWVSWALNPHGSGMVGAQAIIAYKPSPNGPLSISSYDIKSYHDLVEGPISYNVTTLSAEESNGKITIFATWVLPHGESMVNQVWQVGPVHGGMPGKHEFQQDNLGSKMKLDLVNGPRNGLVGAPVGSQSGQHAKALATTPGTNGVASVMVVKVERSFWLVLGAVIVVYLL